MNKLKGLKFSAGRSLRMLAVCSAIMLGGDGVSDSLVDIAGDSYELGVTQNAHFQKLQDKDSGLPAVAKLVGSGILLLLSGSGRESSDRFRLFGSISIPEGAEVDAKTVYDAFLAHHGESRKLVEVALGSIGEGMVLEDLSFDLKNGQVQWGVTLNGDVQDKSMLKVVWDFLNDLLSDKVEHSVELMHPDGDEFKVCLQRSLREQVEEGAIAIRDMVGAFRRKCERG